MAPRRLLPLQRLLSQAKRYHHHHRKWTYPPPPTLLATHHSGGANLEVFKFGLYIMFPIGWMYYFGLNLESRFAVPGFWPEEGSTHRIPFEREELKALGERLRDERRERRRRRLEKEARGGGGGGEGGNGDGREGLVRAGEVGGEGKRKGKGKKRKGEKRKGEEGKGEGEGEGERSGSGTFGVGSIERWARGRWRD